MKHLIFIVLVILFFSCDNVKEEDVVSFPDLILESHSLDDGAYDFCCMDSVLNLIELSWDVYYKHDNVMFVSFVRSPSKQVKKGKLYDDLLFFLSKLDPNYSGYTHSFMENSVSSIMIYSDSTFCGIPREESLNHLFILEGEFIRLVDEKYEFYNGADVLDEAKKMDGILFPEEFRLKLIDGLEIEKKKYRFFLRLKSGNRVMDMKIAEINLM